MENLTHSLLGAALAEAALPRSATTTQRRLFFVSGIVAANLPDGDLVLGNLAPPPLGYLLQHRGYTHTLVGCALLAVGIWLITRFVPAVRRVVSESPARFWLLIGAALASHILADSWNSYGVHPFWPFDNRWYYGDAVFILEPWFWILLGAAAVANTKSSGGRRILGATMAVLPFALAGLRMISVEVLGSLVLGGVIVVLIMARMAPRVRAVTALGGVALYVIALFGLNQVVRARSLASIGSDRRGAIVDVVLSPALAQPFCWSALAVEKIESAGEYVLRRGDVSLLPGRADCGSASTSATPVVWTETFRESLTALRDRSRDDCWVRAWLQFGRAPVLGDGVIDDLRYGSPGAGGFTEMRLRPLADARVCPAHVTNWGMPRADLLSVQ